MSYKDILGVAISLEDDEAALVAAGELTARFGARATALIVAIHLGSDFAQEAQPLSALLDDLAEELTQRDRLLVEREPDESAPDADHANSVHHRWRPAQ